MINDSTITRIIEQALFEDIGFGDITTERTISNEQLGTAHIVAREKGILAGSEIAGLVFRYVDMRLTYSPLLQDGEKLRTDSTVAHIHGPLHSIIEAERTALNFLMRMSGVATRTYQFVQAIKGTGAQITDTRCTIPTLRMLDKYAVKTGGGMNNQFGLDERIRITEHHVYLKGGTEKALMACLEKKDYKPITIEVSSLQQLEEIISYKNDIARVVLINFPSHHIKTAVDAIKGETEVEVSGNVTLDNVRLIAECGVDYISVGELTHSPKSIDFSLLISSS